MSTVTAVAAGTWRVETPARAGFAARNFGVRTVRGTLAVTAGTLELGPDGRPVRLSGALDAASVDTGNPRRDRDLRGRRFLDVAHHPVIEVTAERFEATAAGWLAHAAVRVAGAETTLPLHGVLDGAPDGQRLTVTGTAALHLPDVGIRVPRFLVGRRVELTVTAHLRRTS
ncbi:YceI family protein [Dactylosporangium aurantiacum]|uniref:YceI family protein n=1 Tax=Dactylosporangium aurantiacum TaxID=35754 RepID=A0A9Q9MJY8_9ACTN|nr:YceI family protein [Dactylosporangium aurantiacum]MDG6101853.1 YceI family protein [Dactylosporangium aurantiacum]UWZ52347.1 YceI family protein [Dactylosporangium aurantiacum]